MPSASSELPAGRGCCASNPGRALTGTFRIVPQHDAGIPDGPSVRVTFHRHQPRLGSPDISERHEFHVALKTGCAAARGR